MKIEKKYTSLKKFGDKRKTDDINYIVVQSIGDRPTPHYHVVAEKVYQIIPDNYMSNSVNGARLSRHGVYHGICTKYNCISIGINENPTREDRDLCIHLILTLMQRYNLSSDKIIRQKDITGEVDPEIWFDESDWSRNVIRHINDILNTKTDSLE